MANDSGSKENISHDVNDVYQGTATFGGLQAYSNAGNVVNINPKQVYEKRKNEWLNGAKKAKGKAAQKWAAQNGVMKIVPTRQIQLFSYSTVTDIYDGVPDPRVQVVPITNVSVNPHQVSFDFFSTSEGKIGISNASEKTMSVECDIYVTDLIYYWWNHPGDSSKGYGFNDLNLDEIILRKEKQTKRNDYVSSLEGKSQKACKELLKKINSWEDFELTVKFANFRNTFLTYFTGWECKFVSHAFPSFYGVITDIKYDISEGETAAKWHVKIEEALFITYSDTGKKEDEKKQGTSGGTSSDSGDAGSDTDEENQ